MTERTEWTQEDLIAEAVSRFGTNRLTWAFQCPSCSDIATAQDFIDAGADPNRVGQDCIGRVLGVLLKSNSVNRIPKTNKVRGIRGCDWAAYGIFGGPWIVHVPADDTYPERTIKSFALAPCTKIVD